MTFKTKKVYNYTKNKGKKCFMCNHNARVKGLCINCYQAGKRYNKRGQPKECLA